MSDIAAPAEEPRDSLVKSFAVRFATLYFAQWFVIPTMEPLTGPLVQALGHAFGLGVVPTAETGSGDRLFDWLETIVKLAFALGGAIVWTLLARRRRHDRTNREILRLVLRYGLALMILSYGFGKTEQFPGPSAQQLATPVGELTPMALMWTFMGASLPYAIFGGLLEIAGGFLLLFRRTTLLGATVFAAVMANIVVLNFCYSVGVRLYSMHALVGAIILIAPDARRLWDLFVLNRPVAPREIGPPVRYRKLRIGVLAVKWVLVGITLFHLFGTSLDGFRTRTAPPGPLDGLWRVRRETEEGHEVAPGQAGRWRDVGLSNGYGGLAVLRAEGKEDMRAFTQDDGRGTLRLDVRGGGKRTWAYRLAAPDLLVVQEGSTRVELMRDRTEYPLTHHRFRLIQESPRER